MDAPLRTLKELREGRDNLAVQIANLAVRHEEVPTELLDRYLDWQRALSERVAEGNR